MAIYGLILIASVTEYEIACGSGIMRLSEILMFLFLFINKKNKKLLLII